MMTTVQFFGFFLVSFVFCLFLEDCEMWIAHVSCPVWYLAELIAEGTVLDLYG
jgi:hypothetical protein